MIELNGYEFEWTKRELGARGSVHFLNPQTHVCFETGENTLAFSPRKTPRATRGIEPVDASLNFWGDSAQKLFVARWLVARDFDSVLAFDNRVGLSQPANALVLAVSEAAHSLRFYRLDAQGSEVVDLVGNLGQLAQVRIGLGLDTVLETKIQDLYPLN